MEDVVKQEEQIEEVEQAEAEEVEVMGGEEPEKLPETEDATD